MRRFYATGFNPEGEQVDAPERPFRRRAWRATLVPSREVLVRSLFLILALAVFSPGCTSTTKQHVEHHPDRPACMDAALELEDEAHKEVRLGVNRLHKEETAMHYDKALGLLRDARQLYEDELIAATGTPEAQRNAQGEIDRLDASIRRLSDEKPQ